MTNYPNERDDGGNYSKEPERAAESERKSGQHSGGGNFANDRERAAEAGRKGGQSSGSTRQPSGSQRDDDDDNDDMNQKNTNR